MSFIEEDLLSLDSTPFCFSKWRLVGPWLWNWWVNGAISNVQQLVVSWLMLVGYSAYPWHIFQIPQSSKGGSWQHEAPVRYFSMCLACLHHHVTYLPYPNMTCNIHIFHIYWKNIYKQNIETYSCIEFPPKLILRMEKMAPTAQLWRVQNRQPDLRAFGAASRAFVDWAYEWLIFWW